MVNHDHSNALDSSDGYLEANNYVEILSTEDERLKIVGKELADDTGRAIFTTICRKHVISSNELAKMLNISLPLANWHIHRLMSVDLIRIEKLGMSQKNKPVKYYGPAKTILVIGSAEEQEEEDNNASLRADDHLRSEKKKSAAKKIWARLTNSITMAAIVSFATGASIIYSIENILGTTKSSTSNGGIELADPDAIPSSSFSDSLLSMFYGSLPAGVADILIALFGGAIIGLVVFVFVRKLNPKTQTKTI